MSTRAQMLVVGLHALLGVSVLVSATVLAGLNRTISPELGTLYGAIIGLAGGGAAAVSALGTAINGKAAVPPSLLSELTANVRNLSDHLAGARAQLPSDAPPAPPPPYPAPQPEP